MLEKLRLADILDISRWQKIQDHFAEVLDVPIATVDRRKEFITRISSPHLTSEEAIKALDAVVVASKRFASLQLKNEEKYWKDGVIICGLYYFFVPMQISETTIAYMMVGPVVLGKRPTGAACVDAHAAAKINPESYAHCVKEIKSFTFFGIKSIIEFLYDIAFYILQLEYHNMRFKRKAPELVGVFDRVWRFYTEKLLSALLDVSIHFTGAERGSLMLYDAEKKELYIKKAKGLSRNVVETTRTRLGEGIAGKVAKERKPICISKETKDSRILTLLHKPKLKASICVPIESKNTLLGVLNIATSRLPATKLSENGMDTIDHLLTLINTALADFPSEFFQ